MRGGHHVTGVTSRTITPKTITRAYQTELDLNNQQVTARPQHAGVAHWAYHSGLARKQHADQATGKCPSARELHRALNTRKRTDMPWLYAESTCAPQEALRHLDAAFAHCFHRCRRKKAGQFTGKLGDPQPKIWKPGVGSFRLTGSMVVFADAIQWPRLGRLHLKERGYLPTSGVQVLSTTVSEQAGHVYVSVLVAQEQAVPENTGPAVGVDLGITTLATRSDGTTIPTPRPLTQHLRKRKRLQRAVTRKRQGSHNRQTAARRLSRPCRTVATQHANTLQRRTSRLAKTKSVVVIEDLNVYGILSVRHAEASPAQPGPWGCGLGGVPPTIDVPGGVVRGPRDCGGSVVCRVQDLLRGWVDESLTLADRTCGCQPCGLVLDRDMNAAKTLAKLADSSADSQIACGEGSAGGGRQAVVRVSSVKQEPNT